MLLAYCEWMLSEISRDFNRLFPLSFLFDFCTGAVTVVFSASIFEDRLSCLRDLLNVFIVWIRDF